jgi:LEM-3-like GIY-YIG domain
MSFYIYGLLDPRDDKVFYIGKGTGNRAVSHLKNNNDTTSLKSQRIDEIEGSNCSVRTIMLVRDLSTEIEAYTVESLLIYTAQASGKVLGLHCCLTNSVAGHKQNKFRPFGQSSDISGFEFSEVKSVRGVTPVEYEFLFAKVLSEVDLFKGAVKTTGKYIRSASLPNGFEFVVNPSSPHKVYFEYIARSKTKEQKQHIASISDVSEYSLNEEHCKLYFALPHLNVYQVDEVIEELNIFINQMVGFRT